MQPQLQEPQEPQDANAWFERADQQHRAGNYEAALTSFSHVLKLEPNNPSAWYYQGNTLRMLGRHKDAIASFDKALEVKTNYHEAWNTRGLALDHLGYYHEAIVSFDKALKIKPNFENAWNNRGLSLQNLGWTLNDIKYYHEAIASFDKALKIKPDYPNAWYHRGNTLKRLGRDHYDEAINSYDHALKWSQNQYWEAWKNRGWVFFSLGCYQEALKNWDDGLQKLKPHNQKGRGELHYSKGLAQYRHGLQQEETFPHWSFAEISYRKALNCLKFDHELFRERHLEVLKSLITLYYALNQNDKAQVLLADGSEKLGGLLQEKSLDIDKIRLARKFAGFDQLRVDTLAQSGNWSDALELAEKRKNSCLSWLRYGWSDAPTHSPKYPAIQKLLNSHTAAIYWHVSPAAVTTFILKHNQPPQVHSAPATSDDTTYPATARQLRDFENWVKKWKQNYQDYRTGKEKGTEEKLSTVEGKKPALKDHPWRKGMTAKLDELKNNILDIPAILPHLSDIRQLILIPHRDLHLLPLHYLFPQDFTITYLPSAQIGLDLQQPRTNPGVRLLNVENPKNEPELLWANVESAAISLLYPDSTIPIRGQQATRTQVMTTVQTNEQLGVFHFTGHGQHDINQPLESSLLLAGEEELTLRDIFQLDFNRYYLICLSACETALTSKQGLIDEFVGLLSGFLAKGSAYVVSALWAVDTYTTALLMVHFYQYLQEEKMPPPSALKAAQKWLRTATHRQLIQCYQDLAAKFEGKNSEIQFYLNQRLKSLQKNSDKIDPDQPLYAHPYYWAGFTVTGKV
jgi:CHAT domain-containing protein/Flp pilus assembly protein TadD